jgi:hypothetical protein
LFEHRKQKYPVLSYISEWDSEQAARRYFELYESILRGKWKNMNVTSRTESEIRGTGDSGDFTVRLSAKTVHSFEGLGGPAAASESVRANGSPGKQPPVAVN